MAAPFRCTLDFVPLNQSSSSSLLSSSDLSSRFSSRSVRIFRLFGACSSDRSPLAASMRPSLCRPVLSNWPMSYTTEMRGTGFYFFLMMDNKHYRGLHSQSLWSERLLFFFFFFFPSGVWFTSSAPCLISGEKNQFSVVRQSLEEFLRHVRPVSVQTNMCTRKWQLEMRET